MAEGRVHPRLALVLTGGGARGAYQVGVLKGLGRAFPELRPPLITGVSAGAINAVYLAARPEPLGEAARRLADIWRQLEIDRVVKGNWAWLTGNYFRWISRLGFGAFGGDAKALLDTTPLRGLLEDILLDGGGRISGIEKNLQTGRLDAIALSTVNYGTGQTVHWVQGRDVEPWQAPNRRSRHCELTLDHVMASAALPLIFPAIELEDGWYGDGGIRMAAPLSPALHLGADRLLAVSTRYDRNASEAAVPTFTGYPSPAQIAGNLMNAIFLDVLDQDVQRLERTNRLVGRLPPDQRNGVRPVELMVIRPSEDLGKLAGDVEPQLPSGFRFFASRLGNDEGRSPDFLSLLMFQPEYVRRLINVGERDVMSQLDRLRALIYTSEETTDERTYAASAS